MGNCLFGVGGRDINDVHPNIFAVHNINDDGAKLAAGHLEVTEASIVLHQKGKDILRWPLKCLRRYGAEGDVFSFESGRKCETGPGIYAFRCFRADRLLLLVQERVRLNGGATSNTARNAPENNATNDATLETRRSSSSPLNMVELPARRQSSVGLKTPDDSLGPPEQLAAEYVNVNCGGDNFDGYLVPSTPIVNNNVQVANNNREYQNINTPVAKDLPNSISSQALPGLPPKPEQTVFFREDILFQTKDGDDQGEINYIAVAFESPSPKSPSGTSPSGVLVSCSHGLCPPSPSGLANGMPSPQYSTIDIGRTLALSTTARQQNLRAMKDPEPPARKTRHNSTLSEIASGVVSVVKRNSVID